MDDLRARLESSVALLRCVGRWGRGLLPSVLLAASLSGCDDEPECQISAVFTGSFAGPGGWSPTGREHCGFANTAALAPNTSALVFIDENNEGQSLYVLIEQPSIGAGTYTGRMIFTFEGNVWASYPGTCTVDLAEFEIEDWSRIDFVRFQGTAQCPEALVPSSPDDDSEVFMSDIAFDGHVHAEVITYSFP